MKSAFAKVHRKEENSNPSYELQNKYCNMLRATEANKKMEQIRKQKHASVVHQS